MTSSSSKLNVLILYSCASTHVSTIKEYLESFCHFSKHNIYYASAIRKAECPVCLSIFDVVIIHYSVRLHIKSHLSPAYAEALRRYDGYKVLFIQDEYNNTAQAREWIRELGVNLVFTCVPAEYHHIVYPSDLLPGVEFIQVLTGAVPLHLERFQNPKPLAERKLLIGYRGRGLPFYYGELGREKIEIGRRMREICLARGLRVDIEWETDKRIYEDSWYEFLQSCRATLATESGSNVFDFDGRLEQCIKDALKENPALSYEEAYNRWIAPHEGLIRMNQVSPKIFEAIALKTALVLFEGHYSGVVQPDIHFIPLKKDFSNVNEVLARIQDDDYIQSMVDKAYKDVIETGQYSYQRFIEFVDGCLEERVTSGNNLELITEVIGYKNPATREFTFFSSTHNEGAPAQFLLISKNWKLNHPPAPTADTTPLNSHGGLLSRITKRIKRLANPRGASIQGTQYKGPCGLPN